MNIDIQRRHLPVTHEATSCHQTARGPKIGIALAAIALCAAAAASAQELAPSADASVRGGANAAKNAGRSPSLVVKNCRYAACDRRSYLRFAIVYNASRISCCAFGQRGILPRSLGYES
jgi:hypothetical protein